MYICSYVCVHVHVCISSYVCVCVCVCTQPSKCQFLQDQIAIAMLIVLLLEYIDLFDLNGSVKQTFGRGYPVHYHSILLYFNLSISIVTN